MGDYKLLRVAHSPEQTSNTIYTVLLRNTDDKNARATTPLDTVRLADQTAKMSVNDSA